MTWNLPGKPFVAFSGIIRNPIEPVIRYYPESGRIWYPGISSIQNIKNLVKKCIQYISSMLLNPKCINTLFPVKIINNICQSWDHPNYSTIQTMHLSFENKAFTYFLTQITSQHLPVFILSNLGELRVMPESRAKQDWVGRVWGGFPWAPLQNS